MPATGTKTSSAGSAKARKKQTWTIIIGVGVTLIVLWSLRTMVLRKQIDEIVARANGTLV